MAEPLEGVRVLELPRMGPGAFCTMMLADMGADVLKIEPPPTGTLRDSGPRRGRTRTAPSPPASPTGTGGASPASANTPATYRTPSATRKPMSPASMSRALRSRPPVGVGSDVAPPCRSLLGRGIAAPIRQGSALDGHWTRPLQIDDRLRFRYAPYLARDTTDAGWANWQASTLGNRVSLR